VEGVGGDCLPQWLWEDEEPCGGGGARRGIRRGFVGGATQGERTRRRQLERSTPRMRLSSGPTYFGSLSAEMKRFFEATVDRWSDGPRWKDKLAAAFTNSKTMSGDKLNTLLTWRYSRRSTE
jgi:hypothetical protein